jgi:HTH-type transcriptional regulator / antitoxin HigA
VITNERQYKITKAALSRLRDSLDTVGLERTSRTRSSSILAQAQLDALKSEFEVLAEQIREYEALKSGTVEHFSTTSLNELPGLLVKARIAKGMSQRALAEKLGVKEQQIQRYEATEYDAASLRRIIEVADALGLQVTKQAWFPAVAEQGRTPLSAEYDWSKFPLAEMYRRGWFGVFQGSLHDAINAASDLLSTFLSIADQPTQQALYRKHVRSSGTLDDYALLAWKCRILWRAEEHAESARFEKSRLTGEWINGLVHLSRESSLQPALTYLAHAGITLVVEPHLPQTYLDGATMMLTPRRGVIGMTLRYDRLDNFWFVLLHEIAHLVLHCEEATINTFFDDLDVPGDAVETEADQFAAESLLPGAAWETALARYLQTAETINNLGNQLGISPAIIAGRIRKESENYVILNELVGIGEVRRQFPEVKYGR